MTKELAHHKTAQKESQEKKSSNKIGLTIKLIIFVLLLSVGYAIFEYVQEKMRQQEIVQQDAKKKTAQYDNIETEIFDLAQEHSDKMPENDKITEMTLEEIKVGGVQFIHQELVSSNIRIEALNKEILDIKDEIFKYKNQEKIGRLILSYLDLRKAFLDQGTYQDVLKHFEMLAILDDNLKEEMGKLTPLLPGFLRKDAISQKFNALIPELMVMKGDVDDSLFSQIKQSFSKLIVVRRIDGQIDNQEDQLDAIIFRVENLLNQEKYQEAKKALSELSPKYQKIIKIFADDLNNVIKVREIDQKIINHLKGLA